MESPSLSHYQSYKWIISYLRPQLSRTAVPPGKTSDGLILRSWAAPGLSLSLSRHCLILQTLQSVSPLSPLWSKTSICSNYLGLGWPDPTITIICCLRAFQSEPNMIDESLQNVWPSLACLGHVHNTPVRLHWGQGRSRTDPWYALAVFLSVESKLGIL